MRIRSFSSTLNFAINTIREERQEGNRGFENKFDEYMQNAILYIRKIVESNCESENLSKEEINRIVLENYQKVVDGTFQNTDIPIIAMKYVSIKYLSKHRNEIPELLAEIERRNLSFVEDESYTDDFHENLLITLLAVKNDYEKYYENMKQTNPEYLEEIEEFATRYGKVDGFKKYCDKYSKMKMLPFIARRQVISYAYYTMFGIEGIDEKSLSPKSSAIKYKNSNYIKDYIDTYLDRLEPLYRENLESSIISRIEQIDSFGELVGSVDHYNERMRRIGLPGLGYFINGGKKNYYDELPRVDELIHKDMLSQLDIDVLLRMNSFYNNRLAKVINSYSMALFVLDNLGKTTDVVNGKSLTKSDLSDGVLENLMLKYQTLILPIKTFYTETQRAIENNPEDYHENVQKINVGEDESNSKKQVVLVIDDFADKLCNSWQKEYEEYFKQVLPECDNNLRQDIFLTNILYNPVFLSYRFKHMALKSEYAYLHYLSQENPEKSLNFGIVISGDEVHNMDRKRILLASDGGLNLPNRLHTFKREFTEFLNSYTGKPLVRIYEGFNDFKVGGEYVSSQILLPNAKGHVKYLRDLKKGKLEAKGDKISRKNSINERFIEHVCYCMNSSQFMPSHRIKTMKADSKGKIVEEYIQPIRYLDLSTGKIYLQRENGKLVDKNGIGYGEDMEGKGER